MKKNKRMMIVVLSLIGVIGVSLAYFTASLIFSGNGTSVSSTTATIDNAELRVEGTLEFNDLDILPGHKNVSSIKLTATGDNELIPYNLVWNGSNTLNTSLNYTVYKTSNEIEVESTCKEEKEVVDGALIYQEECTISNIEELGTAISTGVIDTNTSKVILVEDEFVTASPTGEVSYYYIILEYPNLNEDQSSDIGGSFNGEVSVEKSNITPDINIIAAYIKQEDGTYKETSDIPQDGYTINKEKSVCSNGAIPSWTNGGLFIDNLTKSGTSCYLYFDEAIAMDAILVNKTIDDSRSGAITGIFNEKHEDTLYTKQDDWGTSYFYAGNINNNWVHFAGYYWRIIRINGDGSIRMIYNGTSTSGTGTGTQLQESAYNSNGNDNAYVGYMYGSTGASSYSGAHANTTNSTIKGILDNWYRDHIENTEYENSISTEAGFCNDRKVAGSNETWWTSDTKRGYGTNLTAYAPWGRILTTSGSWDSTQTPTLNCSQSNDLFTASGSSKGNKKLIYPIGLITVDEVVLAGGFGGSDNRSYYLYTGQTYWTMSPASFSGGFAFVFTVYSNGDLSWYGVNNSHGVRPVINLKADVSFTGSGTSSNPYVIS